MATFGQNANHLNVIAEGPALTLGEVRDLVDWANLHGVPDAAVVRGNAVPFKWSDLGNVRGATLKSFAIDKPEPLPSDKGGNDT